MLEKIKQLNLFLCEVHSDAKTAKFLKGPMKIIDKVNLFQIFATSSIDFQSAADAKLYFS
jgi:hypothetical protein